jgi:ribosome biogenesis GTPase / thiamine phosphate phosphatase
MAKPDLNLETLGWNSTLEKQFAGFRQEDFAPGRIAVEDKHYYVVFALAGELSCQISGKLLHQAASPAELPKVGDWVALKLLPAEKKAVIHHVLPRLTKLSRKVAGRETEEQVLVTNVDIAFVVQALDQSFNPALLQRHLAMVVDSGVKPVIVLNKTDLCPDLKEKLAAVENIAAGISTISVSALTGQAMGSFKRQARPGQTAVFIGASGVGKSSIINYLYGEDILPTTDVRESDAKGRHTTSWRELIVLPNGALVIDTPGMREFQMWLSGETGQDAFRDVEEIAVKCHFRNCSHTVEKRCAVLEAVEKNELPRERFESYLKLKRELSFLNRAAHRRESIESKRRTRVAQRKRENLRGRPGEE